MCPIRLSLFGDSVDAVVDNIAVAVVAVAVDAVFDDKDGTRA